MIRKTKTNPNGLPKNRVEIYETADGAFSFRVIANGKICGHGIIPVMGQ